METLPENRSVGKGDLNPSTA